MTKKQGADLRGHGQRQWPQLMHRKRLMMRHTEIKSHLTPSLRKQFNQEACYNSGVLNVSPNVGCSQRQLRIREFRPDDQPEVVRANIQFSAKSGAISLDRLEKNSHLESLQN
jgi:hypothetical protein